MVKQSLQQKSSQESSPASLTDYMTATSVSTRDSASDDNSQCKPSSIESVSMKTESDSSSTEASHLSSAEKTEAAEALLEAKVKGECLADVTTPLTIETKFSGTSSSGPSSESTDTASEVGSGFSSPGSSQNSPHLLPDGMDGFWWILEWGGGGGVELLSWCVCFFSFCGVFGNIFF